MPVEKIPNLPGIFHSSLTPETNILHKGHQKAFHRFLLGIHIKLEETDFK